ncbi:hypothetical protein H310_14740 [Aphanomyces invadans]|uniref:Cathepsin propeptide inhibitor domain-containing protein n=1 Tax=Aphanomyces invadans TaxID=157072 RepID=A0A024T8N9_9STRA|nr:hypothetical protein H310_14740 [Aphanomyces invadans]ETV90500.1 hypothetical protein H310_14740 [Aphanomyces invadans]|eukprot:XP_008880888.1 hypothetical protein H310_14740 [Aphanomyces invadans]
MKACFIFCTWLASTALAARQAVGSLSAADQATLQQQLAKWKTLYGPIAKANGFLPQLNTESVDSNGYSVEELQRFHNTVQDAQEAAAANPDAEFSPFNQAQLHQRHPAAGD